MATGRGVQSLDCVQFFAGSRTVAHQALCPWGSPGKSTGVGCRFLLQAIFQAQGLNPHILHLLRVAYQWHTIGEAVRVGKVILILQLKALRLGEVK